MDSNNNANYSTVKILLSDVPDYLKLGLLYRMLSENTNSSNTNELIELPRDKLYNIDVAANDNTDNIDCIRLLLSSLHYWGVDNDCVPHNTILDLVMKDFSFSTNNYDYPVESNQLATLIAVLSDYCDHIDFVKTLHHILVTDNRNSIMDYVCSNGGYLCLIKYLREKYNFAFETKACEFLATKGPLESFQYALECHDCDCSSCSTTAARAGQLELLRCAHHHGCNWGKQICDSAAEAGHLDCLQYAFENGCSWDSVTTAGAAMWGRVLCLQYALEHGCRVDQTAFTAAILSGHLDCLEYLYGKADRNHFNLHNPRWCTFAASHGHLNCLRYLHDIGSGWNESCCQAAAANGNISCLIYAHENGCPWGSACCEGAAFRDHLVCLQYAHENGCQWGEETASYAARGGSLECLKYLHEHGCPWNAHCCANAAKAGHLDCLQYAHENGCIWNARTCFHAAKSGHINCLAYAYENGCPFDTSLLDWIAADRLEAADNAGQLLIRDENVKQYLRSSRSVAHTID